GQLTIVQRTIMLFGHATPGADMQFVHGLGSVQSGMPGVATHPFLIPPFIREIPDHGGGPRGHLASERERVTLVYRVPVVLRYDVILVQSAGADATQETRPDSGGIAARLEAIRLWVPTVEISHHGDSCRIRRPDSEVRTLLARHRVRGRMGTQLLIGA